MYLTHKESHKRVDEVISPHQEIDQPFDKKQQIRVCSIDIRVGNVFWKMKHKSKVIDLGSRMIFEISPRRLWKKEVIENEHAIKLKPGEMILGSTYEKISIPNDLVGKINTRSSYARLGISTACNCDLINPGYEGFVPLEIVNHSKTTFLIRPHLPLCQIFLMPLYGEVSSDYTTNQFSSKYINDDGGPSVWWRDKLVDKVVNSSTQKLSEAALISLREKFEKIDDDGLYRFEKVISDNKYNNTSELIEAFVTSENKKHWRYTVSSEVPKWCFPATFLFSLAQIQNAIEKNSVDIVGMIVWGMCLLSFPFAIYFYWKGKRKFYTDRDEFSGID